MNRTLVLALVAVVVVALLARMMRGGATGAPAPPAPGNAGDADSAREDDPAEDDAWGDPEGEPAPHELVAITSEGDVLIPHQSSVRVLPLGEALAAKAAGVANWEDLKREVLLARAHAGGGLPGDSLDPGDFTAGRVRRGSPGNEPWRVELLGRDGEYIPYVFETEEAARVALAMLERLEIVRRPRDADGEPMPPGAEDFEEARRRYEETLEELANAGDPEVEPGH